MAAQHPSASERGQLDLFRALPGELAPRDAQDLMAYPFFSLSKSHRIRPIDFALGNVSIRVEAVPDHGMATIWDADILIWAASQIVEARDAGLRTSRLMAATPYEILTFTGRGTSLRDYQRLKAALDRLQSTTVATSIRQRANGRRHRFSWINEWHERTDANGRPDGIEMIVPDWFYSAVLDDALILTIDRAYFNLTGGLDRWLYRLVRKHGGRQKAGWRFDFHHLHQKSGSLSPFKRFAFELRDIMRGGRILWGQIIVVFTIVVVMVWAATQWVAFRLGFQPQLGNPWFDVAGWPFYYPPAFFWWWFSYDAYAPGIFTEGAFIATSGAVLAIAAAFFMSIIRAREARNVATYGSARWAEDKEIHAAGLLGPDGVVLGRHSKDYLRHDGPEHVLCFAPTRSGKGVGLVVPTLLTWPGSCIVHDIKGENWNLTAGFRSRHGRVLLFDPTNVHSAAYNPLLEVRQGEWEVRDVQNIADILVDPEGSLDKRNHWEKTSHSLLVGAILHVLYAEKEKTLAGVANFLSDPRRPVEATLRAMMDTPHLGEAGVHPVIASSARELLNKSENERSGVLSTAMSFLGLYRDPVVARVTARCDWRIADLVGAKEPVSLYLVVPPSDINRTKPLIRLILNQVGRRLTEELETSGKRHRLLLMLDEFPALGRLDFFESALAFMAGYGLKAFLIAQSLNQIERAYGQNNAILDNCHVRVAFAANDERTAKRISDALGTATEMRDSTNYAGHRLAPWLGHLMVSRQETARPLLTPGEIMQLPPTDEIVMVAGVPPIRAAKARYYADARFQERVMSPPDLRKQPATVTTSAPDDWTSRIVAAASGNGPASDISDGDPANAGIRREPELPEHEEIIPPPPPPSQEFDFLDDEPDVDAAKARAMRQRMRMIARQASMNPDDGIEL